MHGPYLLPHDVRGLHDAARRQTVVPGEQNGLFQSDTESAARGEDRGQGCEQQLGRGASHARTGDVNVLSKPGQSVPGATGG